MFICARVWLKREIHSSLASSLDNLQNIICNCPSIANMPTSAHTVLIHKIPNYFKFPLKFHKHIKKKNLQFSTSITMHYYPEIFHICRSSDYNCSQTKRKNLSRMVWVYCHTNPNLPQLAFCRYKLDSRKTQTPVHQQKFSFAFLTPTVLITGKYTSSQP